jgi:hypothetical protein
MMRWQLKKVNFLSKLVRFPSCLNKLGMKLLIKFSKVCGSELMFNFLPKANWAGMGRHRSRAIAILVGPPKVLGFTR